MTDQAQADEKLFDKILNGKCLCGAVTIVAHPARQHIEACHCDMCRRWGGIAFTGIQCGSDVSFGGEEHITRYSSSDWAERGFCKICGSNLFYHFTPASNYSFPAGLFDNLEGFTLHEEIFIDEKPDYYNFAEDTVQKTGEEIIEEAKAAGFSFD